MHLFYPRTLQEYEAVAKEVSPRKNPIIKSSSFSHQGPNMIMFYRDVGYVRFTMPSLSDHYGCHSSLFKTDPTFPTGFL